jgi:SnoaL-like domain
VGSGRAWVRRAYLRARRRQGARTGFFRTVAEELEFLKFEPRNFLSGGNQVAVPINIEVKVKSTGNVIKALEIHLWTFGADGKVVRFFHSIDRHAVVLAYRP